MHPVARRQRLEVLLGFTGFFLFIAFVNAVVPLVRGDTAVVPSIVLLSFAGVFALTYRTWRRQPR